MKTMTSQELREQAKVCDERAKALREQAAKIDTDELRQKSVADRLVFAAYDRCPCGAGLAYDPLFEDESSVFKGPLSGCWDCSAILLGTADATVKHTAKLPFAFYEIKSEQQPSAGGANTREPIARNHKGEVLLK
jgi:hypothetical protein